MPPRNFSKRRRVEPVRPREGPTRPSNDPLDTRLTQSLVNALLCLVGKNGPSAKAQMLPLPEAIRLSLQEASRLSDAELLARAYDDILVSLASSSGEKVSRELLIVCAETALKVNAHSRG